MLWHQESARNQFVRATSSTPYDNLGSSAKQVSQGHIFSLDYKIFPTQNWGQNIKVPYLVEPPKDEIYA